MTEAIKITAASVVVQEMAGGTAVYNPAGENIGVIREVIIEKISGSTLYAIIAFGGAFTLGKLHPLPWQLLSHAEDRGGYIVDLSALEIENAPTLVGDGFELTLTADTGRKVDEFYNLQSYWVDSTDHNE